MKFKLSVALFFSIAFVFGSADAREIEIRQQLSKSTFQEIKLGLECPAIIYIVALEQNILNIQNKDINKGVGCSVNGYGVKLNFQGLTKEVYLYSLEGLLNKTGHISLEHKDSELIIKIQVEGEFIENFLSGIIKNYVGSDALSQSIKNISNKIGEYQKPQDKLQPKDLLDMLENEVINNRFRFFIIKDNKKSYNNYDFRFLDSNTFRTFLVLVLFMFIFKRRLF